MTATIALIVIITFMTGTSTGAPYYGKFLGKLSELHHGVSGEVYAVDSRTLYLKDFTYDGQGPTAYFYASSGRIANGAGFRLRDENGSPDVIRRYRKEGITLTLPEGKTLNNIKIFYVWCEEFEVNFGDVKIPRGFDYPRPQKISALKGVHGISSDPIVIVDAQTLLIPNLSYDGEAPDAKFWVGRGPKPSPQGIRVPDENGKEVPLRRYDRKTVVLTLPGDLTVFDIGHFGIWCEAFTVDFGHVQLPQAANIPPSLKQLGISPQSKLNCEVLYDDLAFEVRWAVAGDSIVLQLVAKLGDGEYMSFGVSGDDSRSEMIGGDVVVAWIDKESLKGHAEDYYLAAKSQCSGPTGSCPDDKFKENSNNIRLLNAAKVNGYSIVTYQRHLKPSDEFDRQIHTNRSQAVIWGIGPLNQRNEVSFHTHFTKGDQFIDFGRPAKWNCPMPENEQIKDSTTIVPHVKNSERRRGSTKTTPAPVHDSENSASTRSRNRGNTRRGTTKEVPTPAPVVKRDAWEIPPIKCYEPEDGVFYAQMGPTGGKRGYPAITGHVGWGISWYINGLLIPEINVVRGKTYTFVVEGGSDPEVAAKYHPFYITDDSIGGYEYKSPEEKKKVRIFAGAVSTKDGNVRATGTGRLCHWTQQGELEADDFESFGAYQRSLELKCDQGEPGVIQWTPDEDTPNTVYYQCFTHRYLGWKINVHDQCDEEPAASEQDLSIVPVPDTRVKANDLNNEDIEDKNNPPISELRIASSSLYNPTNPNFKPSPVESVREEITPTSSEAPLSTSSENVIGLKTSTKPTNQSISFPPTLMFQKFVMRRPTVPKLVVRRPYKKPFYKIVQGAIMGPLPKVKKSPLIEVIKPNPDTKQYSGMELAKNTGFKPESIVIEGGFKPIINEKFVKRNVDQEVQSSDRVQSYYLPPAGSPPQISQSYHQRSNIDLEEPIKSDVVSPPDVVVTYDGKRVSGASLTAKVADRSSILEMRASKAAEFIKARPQFVPFKGELPPLNPEIINQKVTQLESRGITRDLESPPISTKLTPVRQKRAVPF